MLEAKNISLSYGENKVLDNLDWQLQAGQIHALVGLNGSGKSSLLNALFGLVGVDSGAFVWQGEKLNPKNIAFLPTQNYFYSKITAWEYLGIFKSQNGKLDIQAWADLLELPLNDLVDGFSTGMKKKLALLGVLSLDLPILILDEPFNGLDLESNLILKEILNSLKEKGKTLLVTSHILEGLMSFSDYIHHLEGGKIKKTYAKGEFDLLEKEVFAQHPKAEAVKKLL